MIRVDLSHMRHFIPLPYEAALTPRLHLAHERLHSGTGAGGEFTGWVSLPRTYDREEFGRIKAAAKKIRGDCVPKRNGMFWRHCTDLPHRTFG